MAKELLVPLKRHEHVGDVLPYLEKISQPGVKIVFLLPFPVAHIRWSRDREVSREADVQTRLAMGLPLYHPWDHPMSSFREKHLSVCEHFWEEEKRLYRERLFPLCEVLRQRGSEIAVNLYTGSLRKALGNYMVSRDFHLIMTRVGIVEWIARFLDGTVSIFQLFNRPTFSPVLLIQPPTLL